MEQMYNTKCTSNNGFWYNIFYMQQAMQQCQLFHIKNNFKGMTDTLNYFLDIDDVPSLLYNFKEATKYSIFLFINFIASCS
jgi:hypothetical protein